MMINLHHISKICFVLISISGSLPSFAYDWSKTNVQISHGQSYLFGDKRRTTIKLEHSSGWIYGENYFYFDTVNPHKRTSILYGKILPSLSLKKITGILQQAYFLSDIQLSAFYYLDELRNDEYGWGATIYMHTGWVDYVDLKVFQKRDPKFSGRTYEIDIFTEYLYQPWHMKWYGLIEWTPKDQNFFKRGSTFNKTGILYDIGRFIYFKDTIYVGIDYQYYHHKLGVAGAKESVWSLRLKINL